MRHKWWPCSEIWLMKKKSSVGFLPSQQSPVPIALFSMHQPLLSDFLQYVLLRETWRQKPNSCIPNACAICLEIKNPQMLQIRPQIAVSWRQQINTERAQTGAERGFLSVLAIWLHCGCQKRCRIQLIPKHNPAFWTNYRQGSGLSIKRLLHRRSLFQCCFTLTFIICVHTDRLNNQNQGKFSTNTPINVFFPLKQWKTFKALRCHDDEHGIKKCR